MGDSARPGRDAADACMVEFLGGNKEEVEAVAEDGAVGPAPLHRGQLGCMVRNLTTWQDFSPFSWQYL